MITALFSAKGSPGVTTAAVALGAVWPRPVVVADLDPAGGDLATRYRGPAGHPLQPDTGLLSLGADARSGRSVALDGHVQTLGGGLPVLLGVSAPEQVLGLGPVWPQVAASLDRPDVDVLADCGRLGATTALMPVLERADLLLAVARPEVAQLAHLRTRLVSLQRAQQATGIAPPLVVLLVAPVGRGTGEQVRRALEASGVRVPVLGVLAEDGRGARAMEIADAGRAARSSLIRSARSIVAGLAGTMTAQQRVSAAHADRWHRDARAVAP